MQSHQRGLLVATFIQGSMGLTRMFLGDVFGGAYFYNAFFSFMGMLRKTLIFVSLCSPRVVNPPRKVAPRPRQASQVAPGPPYQIISPTPTSEKLHKLSVAKGDSTFRCEKCRALASDFMCSVSPTVIL